MAGLSDAAENWLRKNDPEYRKRKRQAEKDASKDIWVRRRRTVGSYQGGQARRRRSRAS